MGGSGSGYRWDKKDTTESQHRVDIRYLRQNGFLRSGCTGTLTWTNSGEETGSIRFQVINGFINLNYRIREYGDQWEDIKEPVELTWTPCNFGGKRPWFICPAKGCGRRVAVIYGAGRYFACRHCYNLTYASQQESIYERASRKSRKIIKRLGGEPFDNPYPKKPKHMHWKTYNRLIAEAEYHEDMSWKLAERHFGTFF